MKVCAYNVSNMREKGVEPIKGKIVNIIKILLFCITLFCQLNYSLKDRLILRRWILEKSRQLTKNKHQKTFNKFVGYLNIYSLC